MPQAQQFERTQVYNYRIGKNIGNAARLKDLLKIAASCKIVRVNFEVVGERVGKTRFLTGKHMDVQQSKNVV